MVRLHRYLAIGVGLMLPLWFLTGTVISFVPFPSLGGAARLAAATPLAGQGRDLPQALQSRCLAFADPQAAAAVERLRLLVVDGALRWLWRDAGGLHACDAASGQPAPRVDAAQAARIVRDFAGSAPVRLDGPLEFDAWTVHDGYLPARPFWRAALGDAAGTELYVSARSGEVLQRTTARERRWNALGARLHWLNLGELRNSFAAWHATIRGIASLALVLVVVGIVLGLSRARQWRRARRPGLSPYRGLRRVHHLAGLGAAFVLLWWLASGWMSLDTGTLFGGESPDAAQRRAWRGLALPLAARRLVAPDPASLGAARELEVLAVAGEPRRVLRGASLPPSAPLPSATLVAAAEAAWVPHRVRRVEPLASDDAYALRGAPYPDGALRLVLDDPAATWLQVDPASGELLSALDGARRWRRWLVDGLHRVDFPLLNRAGDAWHVLLLLGTTVGFVFSMTGVVLAWRRVAGPLRRG